MENLIKKIKENYKLFLIIFVIGLAFGWLVTPSANSNKKTVAHEEHDHSSEATIWTCSMHPQIKMDKPGKCPICSMDLIPLKNNAGNDESTYSPDEIVLTQSAAKLAQIETMEVVEGMPMKSVFLQGKIQADERNISELTSRFSGRIEKLYVNFTGQNVKKGEKLATIYSPELVTAQRELLESVAFKQSRPSLYKAARGKLKLWDLTEKQINNIEENGEPTLYFDVVSPITGTVMMRHVALGDYVKEGTELFKLADLRKVWVMLDAYESDLPWINLNDKVNFTVQALPGNNFNAKVSYIDPFLDPKTRVAKVRLEVKNMNQQLKPEMFVNAHIESQIANKSDKIIIPKTAILWTGKRSVVYVLNPNTKNPAFKYREIVLGPEAGSFYVIDSGLNVGEQIAVNGVFKIDAASQLQGLPSMMNPDGGKVSTGHNHGGMKMDMPKNNSQQSMKNMSTDIKFKKQLSGVYDKYIDMKNAFVESNADKVAIKAEEVKNAISKTDMKLLKGDAHMKWMEQMTTLNKQLQQIISSTDIEVQRKHFSDFNNVFYKSLKAFGLADKTAYYQYCPMAFNNEGAYWLSDNSEIRNPYFGDMMLKCGENRDTINFK